MADRIKGPYAVTIASVWFQFLVLVSGCIGRQLGDLLILSATCSFDYKSQFIGGFVLPSEIHLEFGSCLSLQLRRRTRAHGMVFWWMRVLFVLVSISGIFA